MKKYLITSLSFAVTFSAFAQQRNALTTKDYEHAESFMAYQTEQYVDHASVIPNWINGDQFWYRILGPDKSEFIWVNPLKKTRSAAFDHQKIAVSLSKATGKMYSAATLPFAKINFSADAKFLNFELNKKQWRADLSNYQLTENPSSLNTEKRIMDEVFSPDGKLAAFIKDYNLWIRNTQTKQVTQLTKDGIKDYGYATDNAGWTSSDRPIIRWSPNSKKIATFKQDQRNVGDMYLVTTNVGKPNLKSWKYPLPGDKEIATIKRVIISIDDQKVVDLQVEPDPHRGTLSDDISSGGNGLDDVDWNDDASKLAFVSTSRDHKQEKFRLADAATGAVREIFEETVATQFESGRGSINWRYLDRSKEIIWYSERDNWGHLYLYNAETGKVKNQITKGNWVVTKLLRIDEKNRVLYFEATGTDKINPYFSHFFKIGFNGKNLTPLSPENGNHKITLSPSKDYFIDSYSQLNVPAVTVLRDLNGKIISQLEKTDISRLQATGWKPVTPITVKASDGNTEMYGVMYTPTHLDPTQKYPVINRIYPGPQGGSVGNWSFNASRGDNQSLAELGFIVVEIEGTSNPMRSKSYHDMNYGNMADNTLPDQIAGMQDLAKQYPYIDLNRVGIWGHSGGGFATAAAMFKYPDFFKVGISESGNHDNRNYEDDWGERYNGLLQMQADGKSNYEAQANQNYAANLKGKLMLAHGMMDNNVPPYNTMLVVEALEKANKSFDLVIFPNSAHGFGPYSNYMTRRRWDYFVRNLLDKEPPYDYLLKAKTDPRNNAE